MITATSVFLSQYIIEPDAVAASAPECAVDGVGADRHPGSTATAAGQVLGDTSFGIAAGEPPGRTEVPRQQGTVVGLGDTVGVADAAVPVTEWWKVASAPSTAEAAVAGPHGTFELVYRSGI